MTVTTRTYNDLPKTSHRLTLIEPVGYKFPVQQGKAYYKVFCECSCGRWVCLRRSAYKSGKTVSCGCYREPVDEGYKHGYASKSSPYYWLYSRAVDQQHRCSPKGKYHPKGILFKFKSLEDAVDHYLTLPGCSKDNQIDRIDNTGHYEAGNVRFVSPKQNGRNKSNNVMLSYQGEVRPLSEWAEKFNLPFQVVWSRIQVMKWDTASALTRPVKAIKKASTTPKETQNT